MEFAAVIPAYNEAKTIRAVASQALLQIDKVIVVDDGSQDETGRMLRSLPAIVLRHKENLGKAASLITGCRFAIALGADAIITLDADGQHLPEEIPRLVQASKGQEDAIIIGARARNRQAAPRARRFANRTADFWISWAAGQTILDTQSGFRCYPTTVFQTLSLEPHPESGFVFESEILIDASHHGFLIATEPVSTVYDGTGRASYYRPWRDTAAIVSMVAGKLLQRGLYPKGLLRHMGFRQITAKSRVPREAPAGAHH